jgi:hypothetical protein
MPSQDSYPIYGGRGIGVCDRWRNFENFLVDMGDCPPGQSLDRRDNNRDYEPGNCRWADGKTQGRNKRANHWITFKGETLTLVEWAERVGLKEKTLRARLVDHGWTLERALTAGVRSRAHPPLRPL